MRPERGGTKKLIVAFHFQHANQAAWKCDVCRKQGLEQIRSCGWLPGNRGGAGRPVWGRNGVFATRCPVSEITAASLSWLEEYAVWKLAGGMTLRSLPARTVDAFVVLENELRKEIRDAER